MININCAIAKNLMPLYLDDNLFPEDAFALKAHLQVCPKCSEELRLYKNAFSSLQDLKAEIQDVQWPDISQKVLSQLPADVPYEKPSKVYVISKFKLAVKVAACFILGITLGFLAYSSLFNAPEEANFTPSTKIVLPELGVQGKTLAESLIPHYQTNGIMVTNVTKNSPAAIAGIQPWDVIVEVDNYQCNEVAQLEEIFARFKSLNKDELNIVIVNKKGKKEMFKVKLNK